MWYFGFIPAFMSLLSIVYAFNNARKEDIVSCRWNEAFCTLWLIAALICFK